jgi:hypothetical protein
MWEIRKVIKLLPIIGPLAQCVYKRWINPPPPFCGSEEYWVARYASGGNSGSGSYNELSEFKAEIINGFVTENSIASVIEYGCGDGNQLRLAMYPIYIGYDVSLDAVTVCRRIFGDDRTKVFKLMKDHASECAQLALSLDVIFHLVEDHVYVSYMERLFNSASSYVIIYSSDQDSRPDGKAGHVKHRKFTDWIKNNRPEWILHRYIPNRYPFVGDEEKESFSNFYIYKKVTINNLAA